MEIERYLNKVYKFEKEENFNDLMKHMGIYKLARKFALSTEAKVSLIREADGSYAFVSSTGPVNAKFIFRPGVEFEEATMDHAKCRSIVSFHGNTMQHIQKGNKENVSHQNKSLIGNFQVCKKLRLFVSLLRIDFF